LNQVIAGDYKGGVITWKNARKGLLISVPRFLIGPKKIFVNKNTVSEWEVVDQSSRKSLISGAARGAAGALLFGGVGAIAGAASGKSKTTYQVSIVFNDGKKALCEIDEKTHKFLLSVLY